MRVIAYARRSFVETLCVAETSGNGADGHDRQIETLDVGGARRESRQKPCSQFKLLGVDVARVVLHDVDVDL